MEHLTIATGTYGLTKPLKSGRVRSERIELEFIPAEPITTAGMRRMVREDAFDVCEMAFTTYLCARAAGKALTAIPLFVTRNFHQWAAFRNVRSGIAKPTDLEGKEVGINRGYTVTTGLWVRGILKSEYGVEHRRIHWIATDEEHVADYKAPANVTYRRGKPVAELLAAGAVGAAIGDIRSASPDVAPLIAEAREAGYAYYRKTGIYPVNHGLVIKRALVEAKPWLAGELFAMFKAAKEIYLAELAGGGELTAADQQALALGKVVGGDPFPFGVAANRKALEAIADFAADQQVTPDRVNVEALFAPGTLHLA